MAIALGSAAACGGVSEPRNEPVNSQSSRPDQSSSPRPTTDDEDDANGSQEAFAEVFVPFGGYEFVDAQPSVRRSQLRPIQISVDGVGRLIDANVKIAVKDGEVGVTVTVAAIKHTRGNTAQDVFGALLASVSLRGQPQPAAGGQAFEVDTGTARIFLSPLATSLVLLMAICPPNAPGEDVVEGLLRSVSG